MASAEYAMPPTSAAFRWLDAGAGPSVSAVATGWEEGAEDRLFRTSGPGGEVVLITVARLEGASTPDVVKGVLAAVADLTVPAQGRELLSSVYDQGLAGA